MSCASDAFIPFNAIFSYGSTNLKERSSSDSITVTMKEAPTLPKKAPRRSKVKAASFEDHEFDEIYFPFAKCLCDLEDSFTGDHAPTCPQLHLSPYHRTAPRSRRGKYEADKRKKAIRRRQKEDKRLRDFEAGLEKLKAAERTADPYAQRHYGNALSDSEEDALREQSRIFHLGYAGGCFVHGPYCRKDRLDCTTPRGTKLNPPKSTSYIDLEEKETTGSQKKKKRAARQPPKSKAYIDLEDEDEEEDHGAVSVPATRYDPETIASDFLRVVGKHPHLPPLNAHMEDLPTNTKSRSSN